MQQSPSFFLENIVFAALKKKGSKEREFIISNWDFLIPREPFSIMSIVKSPMGLMVGFMLIVVFLMPKLMENMDLEEMRRAQEEMRNQGVPSLASLLPNAAEAWWAQ